MKTLLLGTASAGLLVGALSVSLAAPPSVVTDGSVNLKPTANGIVVVRKFAPQVVNTATLTAGQYTFTCTVGPSHRTCVQIGYVAGVGSYAPTALTGGKTVAQVYDDDSPASGNGAYLAVSGFSASPGTAWLTSITCNGVTLADSNATYSYIGGAAYWRWSSHFNFVNATKYSCSINHN